ncbi:hypothetical protein CEK25_000663 [Fusarium fujikuroi]|nr:hypothetical protein CEK25_000663 [Fusarium fujikuroi]
MAPRGKIRLKLTRTAKSESTPKSFADLEDEPMPDAGTSPLDSKRQQVPDPDDEKDEDHQPKEESGDEDDAADAAEKDDESVKEPTPPPQLMVRRKRLGRPPKNRPPDWDNMISVPADEANTPRRRGRGGWRGRGGRKGGPAAPKAEQVIDQEGTVAEIANDECVLPEDPEGETKVDKLGNLQGGRDYRCRTFTIIVDDDEKRDMIERDIIPHSYKGRSIGIVTARSVFREFGARIIVGGKRIIDDYNVAQARADGVVEGQLADPDDHFVEGEPYNKNQYVAWHGASAVYHTNVPSVPVPNGKIESKKRKVNVNDMNWMLEHAREASTFNAGINAIRKLNNAGVYDIHTNVMQYPTTMQPTRARIEQVAPEDEQAAADSAIFPPLPTKMARNFFVADTYFETSSAGVISASAVGGTAGSPDFLASFQGLSAVSDEIKDLLPPDCRAAFDGAVAKEASYRSKWGPESETMSRRQPIIDKAIVPYSMS